MKQKLSSKSILTLIGLIMLLILSEPYVLSYNPIVSSRVSKILEVNVESKNWKNSTLFAMKVEVEILNRADTNQTVVESSDFSPKVFINATFFDNNIKLTEISMAHATFMWYSYPSGITVETSIVEFYIDEVGLSQLPDGNYTLWRPINTAYPFFNKTTAEALYTHVSIINGTSQIYYPEFDNFTKKVNVVNLDIALSMFLPLVPIYSFIRVRNIKNRKIVYTKKKNKI